VRLGDVIVEVGGQRVTSLPQFFRSVWSSGGAGVEIPLKLLRGGEAVNVVLRSANRDDFLKKPARH